MSASRLREDVWRAGLSQFRERAKKEKDPAPPAGRYVFICMVPVADATKTRLVGACLWETLLGRVGIESKGRCTCTCQRWYMLVGYACKIVGLVQRLEPKGCLFTSISHPSSSAVFLPPSFLLPSETSNPLLLTVHTQPCPFDIVRGLVACGTRTPAL